MSLSQYLAARSIAGCTHTAIAAGVNAVAGDKVQADEWWSCVCFESLNECVDALIVRLCRDIPGISMRLCVLCILTAQLLARCAPLSLIFLNSPKSPSGESGSRHPRGESGSRHWGQDSDFSRVQCRNLALLCGFIYNELINFSHFRPVQEHRVGEWLARWLHAGAVPVATLNNQRISIKADAWHHHV